MSSLLHPLPRCLPLPPSSDFPSTHGFPPPTPPFPPFPLPGRLLLLSYGPGVGVLPPSGVTTSLVNSTAMRVLLPLPLLLTLLPPLGLPLTRLPPLSLRLWVIQRLLCFLPLLPVFQGVIPVPLVPSTPPLAVGSARSSCCSNFVCFCALFPLTLRVTPSASLQLVLFLLLASCGSDVSLTSTTLLRLLALLSFLGGSSLGFLPLIRTPSDWGVASASGVLGTSVFLCSV